MCGILLEVAPGDLHLWAPLILVSLFLVFHVQLLTWYQSYRTQEASNPEWWQKFYRCIWRAISAVFKGTVASISLLHLRGFLSEDQREYALENRADLESESICILFSLLRGIFFVLFATRGESVAAVTVASTEAWRTSEVGVDCSKRSSGEGSERSEEVCGDNIIWIATRLSRSTGAWRLPRWKTRLQVRGGCEELDNHSTCKIIGLLNHWLPYRWIVGLPDWVSKLLAWNPSIGMDHCEIFPLIPFVLAWSWIGTD